MDFYDFEDFSEEEEEEEVAFIGNQPDLPQISL